MPDVKDLVRQQKFESQLYDVEVRVKEDTSTNNQYFTNPNPIIESYHEIPPETSVAFAHSVSVASLGRVSAHLPLNKYEDQVIPALKGPKKTLDDQIEEYEQLLQKQKRVSGLAVDRFAASSRLSKNDLQE